MPKYQARRGTSTSVTYDHTLILLIIRWLEDRDIEWQLPTAILNKNKIMVKGEDGEWIMVNHRDVITHIAPNKYAIVFSAEGT